MTAVLLLLPIMFLPGIATWQADSNAPGYSIYEELSGTVVNCMLQDSSGFLWFGTQNGLYRYDGYHLKLYSLSSDIANKFFSNFITSISEDNSKNLWIGTFGGGLFKLNPQTEEYANYNPKPPNPDGLGNNTIRAICKDDSGQLWIGTQNKGLNRLDPVSGRFAHYENIAADANSNSISSNTITSICKDKAGCLWFGTDGKSLNKFDPQSGQFLQYKNLLNDANDPGNNNISKLYIDKAGTLWIITEDGKLSRFDTVSEKLITSDFPELKGLKIMAVCEDNAGNLWVGTYGSGVRMLDKNTGKLIRHGYDFSADASTYNYRVVSLFADTSGNLWIGTEDNGIDKINTNMNFTFYNSNTKADMGMNHDVV